MAVTSTPTSLADTYGFGETIVITVTASEAVEVEGDPVFLFSLTDMGGPANDVPATYDDTRSSPTTIVFTYTVQAGDRDNNGIWIGNHSRTFLLDVNDRIRTASQQIDIDRSHPEKGTPADHKVNGSLGAPTVPPGPTPPTLVSATATTLTIEWTHPGDGGSPLTRNFIEYRVEGTTDWTNWYRGETPTPVTRTVIRNLAAATAYDVRVHSTNAIGNSQWVQSATAFSTLAGNAATGAPAITGTAAVGQPLAVDLTGIEDADGLAGVSYSYQWVRVDADGLSNAVDITDATDATDTLVDADLGKTLKVRVTFDDDLGHTETLTSAATATVGAAATAPTVSTVDVTSMPASGDTYGTGEMIQFTVTFDQDVTVTGTPEFEFCLGNSDGGSCTDGSPPPTRRRAALSSGSGTTALVLQPAEARQLLDTIDTSTLRGLRDRALLAVMVYSFARVSAVVGMRVEDYYQQGKRWWLRLQEKGGKHHAVPVHHKAEAYLDAYLDAAGIAAEKDAPLWRSMPRAGGMGARRMSRVDVFRMIKRRVKTVGLGEANCHTFRATGITAYLLNGGTLERAQAIAAHESPRTTKLYDRTADEVTIEDIEKIGI